MSVAVTGPTAPDLADVWRLALVKTERRLGHAPATVDEVNQVVAEYDALLGKRRAPIAALAREVGVKAPET